MNDKVKGILIPKQQLEIVKYEGDIPYGTGGKTLDRMNAKNLSLPEGDPLIGKPVRYTIFNGELKTFLRGQGERARFLCDIEERDRPDSEYGPDRTIVQVYQDGKPVSTKKGGGYGKSPEIVRLEHELNLKLEGVKRRSIEGQTAIAQVGLVLTSPTPIKGEDLRIDEEGWTRILGKYWQAIENGLDNYLAPRPEEKTTAPALKPSEKPQDNQQAAETPTAVTNDAPPVTDPIKHVGDLLTRAMKLEPPVTRGELIAALSLNDPKEITDLEAAWKTAQEISETKVDEKQLGKGQVEKTTVTTSPDPERLFD